MAVAAIGAYEFAPKDTADKFPAPLLFFAWEDHKMFCAPFAVPFPPTLKFADMCQGAFQGIFGAHPDFARIDWDKAEWFKSGQPWKPDMDKSLADNGLGHKDVIRFRTPGLTGLKGSAF
ncbi:phenol hydroxylase subunit P4 [Ottowia testudinis]|uniref:Phenol hydroxylase n=1 Tax=Ottowia testudinis TaxID=2816950 RepID=A0A975CKY1_9BURK|nr:phenol hydroxylase subunit P4 [Ottowia testudinis]QTD45373.1 phenol hydroxylase [Ottowia testudinis]